MIVQRGLFILGLVSTVVNGAGEGVEQYRQGNYFKAAESILSATNKEPIEDYYLGKMYLYGYGLLKNNNLALNYITRAGEKGILPAQQFLGKYNLEITKDPERALYWFKKAAAAGDLKAKMYCAAAYLFGFGVQKNSDLARAYYIDAAKNDNAIAQYTLGMQFLESKDSRNKKLGYLWLNKAALQKNPAAQVKVAELLYNGKVVPLDKAKAHLLIDEAVNQKESSAYLLAANFALQEKNLELARNLLEENAKQGSVEAMFQLAQLYKTKEASFFNYLTSFEWMRQAAEKGFVPAQTELALMYQEGNGVEANVEQAEIWLKKAKSSQQASISAEQAAANWLSGNKANTLSECGYQLKGILNDWHNPEALKQNNYNPSPKMNTLSKNDLYHPEFKMIMPSEIQISDYFDLLAATSNTELPWQFPRYPLAKAIETIKDKEAKNPSSAANNAELNAQYQSVLNDLYSKAILGDAASQFELGQLYHYGIGVAKNFEQAVTYYQFAAQQQDVRAEYNLALLYLKDKQDPAHYRTGINWLIDAAFKGNRFAQYALGHFYKQGLTTPSGEVILNQDAEESMSMYYLASANGYGPALYQLADELVKQKQSGLDVVAQKNRVRLIRQLYESAVREGIKAAETPLQFYNAMEHSENRKIALDFARKEASLDNPQASLLLAILLDRDKETNKREVLTNLESLNTNPAAAFILGTYYSEGGEGNKAEGKKLLEQAAAAGFSYAYYNLAILNYKQDNDFIANLEKARELGNSKAGLLLADDTFAHQNPAKMKQAQEIYLYFAEKGDQEAQLKLGYLYEQGLLGSPDYALAAKWYTLSAEQGQALAQYLLGRMYQLGRIDSGPNYVEAKKWYQKASPYYSSAAVALGFLYETVDDDYKNALIQYQQAAQENNIVAAYNVGLIYQEGKGIKPSFAEARLNFNKAVQYNYSPAMVQLAALELTENNERAALQWYEQAAKTANADAFYHLGLLYETGVAVHLDFIKAAEYYQRAAQRGNEKGMLALARMYHYGLGVSKDQAQALELYKKLAINQNTFGQYQLAQFYLQEEPSHKHLDAMELLRQAGGNGNNQARKKLQWLEAQQKELVSYIEPIRFNEYKIREMTPNRMYLEALSEWNRGDESGTSDILGEIVNQYPSYQPARQALEYIKNNNKLES